MRRFITEKLVEWKNQERRKPLIVRGARQVGKTWSINDFGRHHFEGAVHLVDLEKRPDWHRIFDGNLVAKRVISELEILLNARINPGKDLLFIDEIQSCPQAIKMLRYFYEDIPELHVITAGSLLEFAVRDIPFPVGRVQFITMHPMTFAEFLFAKGMDHAAKAVLSPRRKQSDSVHSMLLEELRQYMFTGGMPESVSAYVKSGKLLDAFEVQGELVNAFRQDFSKYAPHSDKKCLNAVFSATARSVGSQIKYVRLAESYTVPTIKKAFDLLCLARVIRKVPSASPAGLPLGVSASPGRFKAVMVDIGLMQHLCGMPVEIEYGRSDLLAIYRGALAEQFIGQELVAAGQEDLCYWSREAKSSSAEVDYLVVLDGRIYPIEIKSGSSGKLKSLHMLLETYPGCPSGIVFSSAPYAELPERRLVLLPIYHAYAFASGAVPLK